MPKPGLRRLPQARFDSHSRAHVMCNSVAQTRNPEGESTHAARAKPRGVPGWLQDVIHESTDRRLTVANHELWRSLADGSFRAARAPQPGGRLLAAGRHLPAVPRAEPPEDQHLPRSRDQRLARVAVEEPADRAAPRAVVPRLGRGVRHAARRDVRRRAAGRDDRDHRLVLARLPARRSRRRHGGDQLRDRGRDRRVDAAGRAQRRPT